MVPFEISYYAVIVHINGCCLSVFTTEEQENATFYIADKGGIPVWSGDQFELDIESTGREKEERMWTLGQYMQLCGIKFASKTKFYCVRKGIGSSGQV